MESFLNETEVFDNLFKRLKQMQIYLYDMKKLDAFNLPKPVCLQNAYMMNMYYLNKKWLDKFPSLQTIEKLIQDGKKLFFLPERDYYYLYYHLLVAYKNFQELGDNKKIYDDETHLDYDSLSTYISRKNLSAVDFFESYFERGLNFHDKSAGEATDYMIDEDIPHEMSSEPAAPPLELSESEIEVAKTVSPLSFLGETKVENYSEEKKVKENEIY